MQSPRSRARLVAGLLLVSFLLGRQAAAANLVVNGGFEAGNADFSTDYLYVTPTPQSSCYPEGSYTIGSNPNNCHNLWASFSPHTGNAMMIVNGATTAGANVWQQSGITVAPATNYLFSVWVASNYPASPAELAFSINGVQVGASFVASSTPGVWEEFVAGWNSGGNVAAQLDIVDLNTDAGGNDFALDDISLTANNRTAGAVPEPASLLMMGSALIGLGWTRRKAVRAAAAALG